jgi:Rv0078B-related antitoxin
MVKRCLRSRFARGTLLPEMSPESALEMQIERYRQMSPAQRIELALRLHELASEVARSGIRAQHPKATDEQVEEMLRERRRLAYQL